MSCHTPTNYSEIHAFFVTLPSIKAPGRTLIDIIYQNKTFMHIFTSIKRPALALGTLCLTAAMASADEFVLSANDDMAAFPQTAQGYWTETYSCLGKYQHLDLGIFSLTHNISEDPESADAAFSWSGFIVSTNGSDADMMNEPGGWIANQWGCMAGGGIKSVGAGNTPVVEKGLPYFMVYWSYYVDQTMDMRTCEVKFNTDGPCAPQGVFVSPTPWAYYGNEVGDGWARPLKQEGDIETVTFHGLDADGNEVSSVTHTMAEAVADGDGYRCEQNPGWVWVDLTPLGEVSAMYITMQTTDVHPEYGPNSALFFCLDRLTVTGTAGIGNVATDTAADLPAEYFTIDGRKVSEPSNGLYICRRGTTATKVLVR